MDEIERTDGIIARCRRCDELLHDGDTAYKLCGAYFCPQCVEHSLVICRKDDYYDYDLLKYRRYTGKDD